MILIDNYQLIMPNLFRLEAALKLEGDGVKDTQTILNVINTNVLSKYAEYAKLYTKTYGKIFICTEGGNSWRKDINPCYKANRSKLNTPFWSCAFAALTIFESEVNSNLYPVLEIAKTEADDIIGTLAIKYHTTEKILIISGDKDFTQLLYYPNIDIYNPHLKSMIKCNDPSEFLIEQIIRGDSSDGIPNVTSPLDILVKRDEHGKQLQKQKAITQKVLKTIKENVYNQAFTTGDPILRRFRENEELIDLHKVPASHKVAIDVLYNLNNKNYLRSHDWFKFLINSGTTNVDFYGGLLKNVYCNL